MTLEDYIRIRHFKKKVINILTRPLYWLPFVRLPVCAITYYLATPSDDMQCSRRPKDFDDRMVTRTHIYGRYQ